MESVNAVKTTVMGSDVSRFVAEIEFDGEVMAYVSWNSTTCQRFIPPSKMSMNSDHSSSSTATTSSTQSVMKWTAEAEIHQAAPGVRYVDIEAD